MRKKPERERSNRQPHPAANFLSQLYLPWSVGTYTWCHRLKPINLWEFHTCHSQCTRWKRILKNELGDTDRLYSNTLLFTCIPNGFLNICTNFSLWCFKSIFRKKCNKHFSQEDFILFMFAGIFSACMSVNYLHTWYLQGPEESIIIPWN